MRYLSNQTPWCPSDLSHTSAEGGFVAQKFLPCNYFLIVGYSTGWKNRLGSIYPDFVRRDRVEGHLSNDVQIAFSTCLHGLHPAHRKTVWGSTGFLC